MRPPTPVQRIISKDPELQPLEHYPKPLRRHIQRTPGPPARGNSYRELGFKIPWRPRVPKWFRGGRFKLRPRSSSQARRHRQRAHEHRALGRRACRIETEIRVHRGPQEGSQIRHRRDRQDMAKPPCHLPRFSPDRIMPASGLPTRGTAVTGGEHGNFGGVPTPPPQVPLLWE